MGFWDKVKSLFGGQPPAEQADKADAPALFDERGFATPALERRVAKRIHKKVAKRHLFTRDDVAAKVLEKVADPPAFASTLAGNAVLKLKKEGLFEELGYECSYSVAARAEVFHPKGTSPEGYPGPGGGPSTRKAHASGARATASSPVAPAAPVATRTPTRSGAPRAPAPAPSPVAAGAPGRGARAPARPPAPSPVAAGAPARGAGPYRSHPSAFDPGHSLGMSADELRRRALKIWPWRTPWIGRVDVIPPTSDERTALIDRGLVLRGWFTDQDLAEIHRVGDLWLEHERAVRGVGERARKVAAADLQALKQQKLADKAAKKQAAAERRAQLVAAVARRRAEDIVFLGRGHSGKLADRRADIEALHRGGLPVLTTPADVARALGIDIPTLRWLAFHSEAAETIHYRQFEVPKKTGGMRLLSAPLPKLAAAQRWILDNVLAKVAVSAEAHGFVDGRSTVSNARPHVGRDVVINVDLRDFFPSIRFPRVRGLFESLGFSPAVATVLALLTTEAPRRKVAYAGKTHWVAAGPRGLPQGACTSPAISNLVSRKLDARMLGMSNRHGLRYTRYADDLTVSMEAGRRADIGMMLARIRHITEEEGFDLHPRKVAVQRAGGRQMVTGIVVNRGMSVPREEIRRIRAVLHAARKTGLLAQNRDAVKDFRAHLRGKIAYVAMIDRERGARLLKALEGVGD